jgi:hypothetical protein
LPIFLLALRLTVSSEIPKIRHQSSPSTPHIKFKKRLLKTI